MWVSINRYIGEKSVGVRETDMGKRPPRRADASSEHGSHTVRRRDPTAVLALLLQLYMLLTVITYERTETLMVTRAANTPHQTNNGTARRRRIYHRGLRVHIRIMSTHMEKFYWPFRGGVIPWYCGGLNSK